MSTGVRPSPSLSKTNRRVILWASLAVIGLSAVLSLGGSGERVMIPLLNVPLPPVCTMKRLLDVDCPGCGLTRSFVAMGHGQWQHAFGFNAAGPLWFALIAAQIPWQLIQLRRIARGQKELDLGWFGQALLYSALAVLIVQWVVRQSGWLY